MDIFQQFGIDVRLLVVQIFNFIVLLFILKKFLYKPIVDIIEKRRTDIEESAKKVEEIKKQSQESEEKVNIMLQEAREKAHDIIVRAEKQAAETKKNAQEEARKQAEEMLAHAKKSIEAEKEALMKSVQKDIVRLVVLASTKVLGRELANSQEEFIEKEIKKLQ